MTYTTIAPEGCQVLHDTSRAGRDRPWARHKSDAQLLSYALEATDHDAAERVRHCADRLWFSRREDGGLRLASSMFCRVRVCPVCQWRRSLKTYGQLRQIVDYLDHQRAAQGRKAYSWVLLTLTIRNVPGEGLRGALDALSAAWDRMTRRKAWTQAIQGMLRSVEITYNRQSHEYHPHIHVLACVLPSYWHSRYYLTQAAITALWQDALRVDYTPIVDIRRCTDTQGSLAEVAKYATKPSDYLDPSDVDMMADVSGTLHMVCRGRRFAAWSGVCKQAHKALHLDDTDSGDLVHIADPDAGESDAGAIHWAWDWYAGPRLYIGGVIHD